MPYLIYIFLVHPNAFPLYLYDVEEDSNSKNEGGLFASGASTKARLAITDEGLGHFVKFYEKAKITKEDIFYYVYGLLHSEDYRKKYANNLSKELPRIPCVKNINDFWSFVKAGRELGNLHVNYESAKVYPLKIEPIKKLGGDDYKVTQMKFGKGKYDGSNSSGDGDNTDIITKKAVKSGDGGAISGCRDGANGGDNTRAPTLLSKNEQEDKSTIHYNEYITIRNIPLEAYNYIVNGKSALEWIVESYRVETEKKTGLTNNANDWVTENETNPKYILDLLGRVVTVSLETLRIVQSLPKMEV